MVGSSPQVRGARSTRRALSGIRRLIPAGAGSTTRGPRSTTSSWAHPRRCGEHSNSCQPAGTCGGSSPQVRGARARRWCPWFSRGLIPAGAGSTPPVACPVCLHRAHPRRCGEHDWAEIAAVYDRGSSPQVRGALPGRRRASGEVGLIPAGAGSTRPSGGRRRGRTAHPRRCGEHAHGDRPRQQAQGSSPQVRGARRRLGGGDRHGGLIPAGAGSTPPSAQR